MKLKLTVNGIAYEVEVEVEEQNAPQLGIFMPGGSFAASQLASVGAASSTDPSFSGVGDGIKAPLAGTVSQILVEIGQQIDTGQTLIILEAMKMETAITAPSVGIVAAITVAKGDSVQGGQILLELEPLADDNETQETGESAS